MKQMNKQQRLKEIEILRHAYLKEIMIAQANLRELNLERQNLIMKEED